MLDIDWGFVTLGCSMNADVQGLRGRLVLWRTRSYSRVVGLSAVFLSVLTFNFFFLSGMSVVILKGF